MDREHFINTEADSWWLVQTSLDYYLEQERRLLGEALGLIDPRWFADSNNLDALYRKLEAEQTTLLKDLDEMTTDDLRLAWMKLVIVGVKPATVGHAIEEAEPVANPVATPDPKPAPAPAPAAKPSPFAKKKPATDATAPAETPELKAAAHEVLSQVSGERAEVLAAQVELTAEEITQLVADPDFERMVLEEAAALAGGAKG